MLRVLPPTKKTLATLFVARQIKTWVENAQQRYSTRFAVMLQNKLHVSCCPLYRTVREHQNLKLQLPGC